MGWQPNYQSEARIYAKYILKEKPDAKIGVLYQNDDFGKDYVEGPQGRARRQGRIDDRRRGDATRPPIRPSTRRSSAEGAGRRRLRQHRDAEIRRAGDPQGRRHRAGSRCISSTASAVGRRRDEAGRASRIAKASISASYVKDATDPQWNNDPGMKKWLAFMDKYYPRRQQDRRRQRLWLRRSRRRWCRCSSSAATT